MVRRRAQPPARRQQLLTNSHRSPCPLAPEPVLSSAALDENLADIPLPEVLHLCMSSSPRQRSAMLQILARRTAKVDDDPTIKARAWQVGEAALAPREGVDVARSGVELLWEILVGSDVDEWVGKGEEELLLPVGLRRQPLDAQTILPRLAAVVPVLIDRMATPSFTAKTRHQILWILLALSTLPSPMPTTLLDPLPQSPLLHAIVKSLLSPQPDPTALRLVVSLVQSSRENAEVVWKSNSGVGGAVLRFISSSPTTSVDLALAKQVLDLFGAWAEYGLASSSCADAADLWRSLGASIHASSRPSLLRSAYYRLVTRWTVCAVNPHSTSPEHDITWSQISGMGWWDDFLTCLPQVLADPRAPGLADVCDFGRAWVEGAVINEPVHGEDAKKALSRALSQSAVESLVLQVGKRISDGLAAPSVAWDACVEDIHLLHSVVSLGATVYPPVSWSPAAVASLDSLYLTLVDRPPPVEHVHRRQTNALLVTLHGLLPKRQDWLATSFFLLANLVPGDEPLGLVLLGAILATPTADLLHAAGLPSDLAKTVTHRHGLAILEPFYRFTLSPSSEAHASPLRPSSATLRQVTTLRIPSHETVSFFPRSPVAYPKSRCGLPLSRSWTSSPLDELLHSTSSGAFVGCPPDWDASETELTQATLLFSLVGQASLAQARQGASPTEAVYECLKVFALEQNVVQPDVVVGGIVKDAEGSEVYRDRAVETLMRAILRPFQLASRPPAPSPPSSTNLDSVHASSSLNSGAPPPFFYLYSDLHALYASTSFGHAVFALLLLTPLGPGASYAVDYRRLFWAEEHVVLLRAITLAPSEAVLETDWAAWLGRRGERDAMVLQGYVRALARDVEKDRNPLLYALAVHGLAMTLWSTEDDDDAPAKPTTTKASATPLDSSQGTTPGGGGSSPPAPRSLARALASALPPSVVRDIVRYGSARVDGRGWDDVRADVLDERLRLLGDWLGPDARVLQAIR